MWQLTKESTHASCRWPAGMRKPRGFACCPMIKMQLVAVFIPRGKLPVGPGWISRRLRSRLGKLPSVHFPHSEYSRQLPKARYAVFQGFTITCRRYISVICCLEHSSLITPPPLPPPPPPPPPPLPLPPHHSLTRALGNEQSWSGGDPTQNPSTQHNLRCLASCPTRTSPWPE